MRIATSRSLATPLSGFGNEMTQDGRSPTQADDTLEEVWTVMRLPSEVKRSEEFIHERASADGSPANTLDAPNGLPHLPSGGV